MIGEILTFVGLAEAVVKGVTNYANGCSLCGARTPFDRLEELKANLEEFGCSTASFQNVDCVCPECFEARKVCRCEVTGEILRQRDNVIDRFLSTSMPTNLAPYHAYSEVKTSLSEEGLARIEEEHRRVQARLAAWAGTSKRDHLPGHRIERAICKIITIARHETVEEAEYHLKWHAAQVGGNAYVQFYWHRHQDEREERYVAGHGPRGNPYYRTRRWREVWYSAEAVAVLAERLPPRQKPESSGPRPGASEGRGRRSAPPPPRQEPHDVRYRRVLGLAEEFTREELARAYKERMKKYHPDRVSDLGEELQALAEEMTKEINAAYAFFKARVR